MQKNTAITIGVVTLIVGLSIGYGVGASNAFGFVTKQSNGGHMMQNGSMMQDSMTSMNAELKGKTGDAFDQAFLAEMIVHHQGAVEMAQSALTNAKHQEIKDLAKAIITAQNNEIADMNMWKKAWYNQ